MCACLQEKGNEQQQQQQKSRWVFQKGGSDLPGLVNLEIA